MKNTVLDKLNRLELPSTKDDLDTFLHSFKEEIKSHQEKYPQLLFDLEKTEETRELYENKLDALFEKPAVKNRSELEKLMYAMIWKQGDIKKLNGIKAGICGEEAPTPTSTVFHQFGKHLKNKSEPIIDQHVLRAFVMSKHCELSDEGWSKKSAIRKSDQHLIDSYVLWISQLIPRSLSERERLECRYKLDVALFVIGKSLKTSKA